MNRALAWLLLAVASEPALAHAPLTTTVQFDREVVRILDNHCVVCHEEKGPAFPLVTYEQTYASRWKIRQDALNRHMAPWAAVAGYGDFANGNGLTQREIDFLVSWAESYGPRNNGQVYTGIATTTAPKVIQAHFDFGRWTLGDPDVRLALPANKIGPQPATQTQRVILDPRLTADRWLRGLEYKPGDRRVVRAVSFTVRESGQWIGSWTPWYGFFSLPKGLAYKLPARSHIIAEIQYHSTAEPVVDQGSLGLYFANEATQCAITNLRLGARPASPATAGKLVATTKLDADTNILALQPQIHPGVQSIQVRARAPNGVTQVLLFATDIPTDWPTPYIFRNPVSLPKGTELSVTEHYAGDSSISAAGIPVLFTVSP